MKVKVYKQGKSGLSVECQSNSFCLAINFLSCLQRKLNIQKVVEILWSGKSGLSVEWQFSEWRQVVFALQPFSVDSHKFILSDSHTYKIY